MSEGSTEKGQFVNIENYLNRAENSSSWADETEEDHERESKPRAWATVPSVIDEAPNLYEIQAEEKKAAAEASSRAAAEAAKRPYRAPQKSQTSRESYNDNPERYHERSHDRPPREKQPIPTEPPYTAFIGNLAYDVSDEDIMEYFGELGVVSIRLLKDNTTGKPKGFGYIEFESAEGLAKGLMANDMKLKGRQMNLDVAKPQQASSSLWGSSGNRERNTRPFKQDTTWGPSPGGSFKDRMNFNRSSPQSSERPKLNINPPKPPISPREPPKSKPSVESIFGTNINEDEVKKMNKLSEERVKKELEKEAQKREQDKKDREKRLVSPRAPARGDNQQEDRLSTSWRGNSSKGSTTVKPPYNMNFSRQDQDHSKPAARVPQKPVVDSEGFRGQSTRPTGHNRGWENTGNSRSSEAQKNNNPKEIQNKFDCLQMGDEE